MPYVVSLTEAAERDLVDIFDYIAGTNSPAAANRMLAALEGLCGRLAEFPERGNVVKELRDVGITEYRELHHGAHRVIYRVFAKGVIVYIVADGRRDMQSLLERRLLD